MNTPVATHALQSQERTSGPDLQIFIVFCLIGLLLMLCVAVRFPELGAVIAQYNLM